MKLERTRIVSPVNGYVTNLLAQFGDYANAGQNLISLVDADSLWVDGYFEETNLHRIRVGDPASIKLMGTSEIIRGHVDSIARGINVSTRNPMVKGWRPLIRSSPGCDWPSASPFAFISIRCNPV